MQFNDNYACYFLMLLADPAEIKIKSAKRSQPLCRFGYLVTQLQSKYESVQLVLVSIF